MPTPDHSGGRSASPRTRGVLEHRALYRSAGSDKEANEEEYRKKDIKNRKGFGTAAEGGEVAAVVLDPEALAV